MGVARMRVATKRVVASTVSGPHRVRRSEWRRSLHRFRRNRGAVIGGIVLGCIAVMALAAPWITPYDPLVQAPAMSLEPPSWAHPFGTDLVGRDVLSRVIAGSR